MRRSLSYAAGLLLVAQAAIHLQQYFAADFGQVPVIGPLFVVHALLAVIIAGLIVWRGRRSAAVAGVALSVGAIVALVLAKSGGLFGFSSGPWRLVEIVTVVIEAVTVVVLVAVASMGDRSAG